MMDDRQVPRSGGAGQRGTEVGAVPVFPVSPSHPHAHSRPSPDWTRPTHYGGQPASLNSTDVTASLLQKRPPRNIDHISGTRSPARLARELPTKTLTGLCTGHHVPPLCWGARSCCDTQDQESRGCRGQRCARLRAWAKQSPGRATFVGIRGRGRGETTPWDVGPV